MMRCLRCALEYPPEERYCPRCGRALSRPPGGEKPDDGGQSSTAEDTTHLYSTFSPPGSGRTVQAPAQMDRDASGARSGGIADAFDDQEDVLAALSWGRARGGAPLPDEEDTRALPHPFRVKQATNGTKQGPLRVRRTRQGIAAAIVGAILLVAAAAGFMRHGAYARDLQAAREQAAAGDYAAAIAHYQAAIDEWPFNSVATSELANLQATTTAAATQTQAAAAAAGVRLAMFRARGAQLRAAAQQADADAAATAIPQATAPTAAQATATAAAGIRLAMFQARSAKLQAAAQRVATAGAATATAIAQATVAAQTQATAAATATANGR